MDLDNPSILNYNIASCTTQIVNLDENADFQVIINAVIFSAIMIGMIALDFLFARAARFGYGSDGSDVRGGVLLEMLAHFILCQINFLS